MFRPKHLLNIQTDRAHDLTHFAAVPLKFFDTAFVANERDAIVQIRVNPHHQQTQGLCNFDIHKAPLTESAPVSTAPSYYRERQHWHRHFGYSNVSKWPDRAVRGRWGPPSSELDPQRPNRDDRYRLLQLQPTWAPVQPVSRQSESPVS